MKKAILCAFALKKRMHNIIDNDLLTMTLDPQKHRLYCNMRGFWQYNQENADQVQSLFQQLAQQPGVHTVVLDTSEMKIMQPNVAEHFLPVFTKYMLDTQIKALGHVGDPDNTVLRLQFQRVLSHIERANDVRHETFLQQQDAERWLDAL